MTGGLAEFCRLIFDLTGSLVHAGGLLRMSDTTSMTLLERLQSQSDQEAWSLMVDLYWPLISKWIHHQGLTSSEAEDVAQEVLSVVIRRLPDFQHNERVGSFRCWLRTITVNCLREFWRSQKNKPLATGTSSFQQILQELTDDHSPLSNQWDAEHDQHVTNYLLKAIEPEFQENTWQAFRLVVLQGEKPAKVAADLGMTPNAVLIAKSRVLARLRERGQGLLDEVV